MNVCCIISGEKDIVTKDQKLNHRSNWSQMNMNENDDKKV